jgi:hypothetical protein
MSIILTYRLPVPETLIDAIIDFLKSNYENTYTSRQIAQYFWDNYTYCEFKTFEQVCAEVNAQIAIHKNKKGRYTQTRPLQITEYQTVPYTYQYKDLTENTTLQKIDTNKKVITQLNFNDLIENKEVVCEDVLLLEDVKAGDITNKINSNKASLIHWLDTSDDKPSTIAEIIKIIAEYA